MKLSVHKDNQLVEKVDLSGEVTSESGPAATFWVGRSPDCHVVLDDQQVSREHAQIIYEDKKWILRQLSEYGRFSVNGESCTKSELHDGDIVSIGPFVLNVAFDERPNIETKTVEFPAEKEESSASEANSTETKQTSSTGTFDMSFENQEKVQEEPQGEVSEEGSVLEETFGQEEPFQEPMADVSQENPFQEEDFSNEEEQFPLEESSEDKTQMISSFAKFELELFGEHAPYDKYVIDEVETFIGRDPRKCQIVLNDPEVSALHAVIKKSNVLCTLEDLNSANGTILNGKRINRETLTNNDEFIIGSTTFTVHVGSDFLEKEKDRLMPVEENQIVEVEEVMDVAADFNDEQADFSGDEGEKSLVDKIKELFTKDALKDPEKRKKILIGLVVVLMIWVFLDETKPPEGAKTQNNTKKQVPKKVATETQRKLSPQEIEFVDSTYQLAKELFEQGKYTEAIFELEKIFPLAPDYKNSRQIFDLSKQGLAKLEELEKKRQEEIEKKVRMEKVKELLVKAKKATEEHSIEVAEALFNQIIELDPENFDVAQLKVELDAWKKEQERIAVEKAQKEAERKRQVDQLAPGKTYYLKKEWYKAILKLESFLKEKGIDEDLVQEATTMLTESRENLSSVVQPLLGKARSLREGQDFKGAYEAYRDVLIHDPTNVEAINEVNEIRETLDTRSKRLYREAIISESLSLFEDAKEKLQEVKQISPSDSEYYQKADEKLKNYID